jgi:hypothetical protein
MTAAHKRRLAELETPFMPPEELRPWRRVIVRADDPEPKAGPGERLIIRHIVRWPEVEQ